MSLKKILLSKDLTYINVGHKFFLIGLFFLPSSLFLAALFLIPALIIGFWDQRLFFYKSIWNRLLFLCGFLILTSALLQNFVFANEFSEIWDASLSLIGTINWLPYLFLFFSFKPYLNNNEKRKNTALVLIASTFPVLISGFGQYFFNWYGPFKALNGLLIWYQRPSEHLTAMFSNQNYTGSWLLIVWPFCISLILEKTKSLFRKTISIAFLFSIGFAAFLTNSRSTWGGIFLSLPFVIGSESLIWILPIIGFILLIIALTVSPIFSGEIQEILKNTIPKNIWMEFSQEGFKTLDATRLEVLLSAFKISLIKPLFGIGAGSFTSIYLLKNGFWKGHSHNLLLELAISYGLPVSIFLFLIISLILFISGRIIFFGKDKNEKNYFERAWWAAVFVYLISQLVDIQYFDGKISIIFWILLIGLKNIIEDDKNIKTLFPRKMNFPKSNLKFF